MVIGRLQRIRRIYWEAFAFAGTRSIFYAVLFHVTATVWLASEIYGLFTSTLNVNGGAWQVHSLILR